MLARAHVAWYYIFGMSYDQLPDEQTIQTTAAALNKNGFQTTIVNTGEEAKTEALKLIPEGAEVMTMTSVTNDTTGLTRELDESGKYNSVRNALKSMDRTVQSLEMHKLGATPEYVTGSVHAVTEDGHLLVASNSGSQLPAEVYGASHVIFVVGAQKIVQDTEEGIKRIYEHSLPLEDKRAREAYGMGSSVSKLLIYNTEKKTNRIHVILIRQVLGF